LGVCVSTVKNAKSESPLPGKYRTPFRLRKHEYRTSHELSGRSLVEDEAIPELLAESLGRDGFEAEEAATLAHTRGSPSRTAGPRPYSR
jgi:hypothetical protein